MGKEKTYTMYSPYKQKAEMVQKILGKSDISPPPKNTCGDCVKYYNVVITSFFGLAAVTGTLDVRNNNKGLDAFIFFFKQHI